MAATRTTKKNTTDLIAQMRALLDEALAASVEPEPTPEPEPQATHEALVEASPYSFTKGRVTLTADVIKAIAAFDGEPVIVPTGHKYPAAVVLFAHDGELAVQNLKSGK